MMQQLVRKPNKKRPVRGPVRFPNICEFSEKYNLNRSHVYRVLTGERPSPRIHYLWSRFNEKDS